MAKLFRYRILKWRVVDGDTIDASIDMGFDLRHDVYIRLNGIDTPEDVGSEKHAGIPVSQVLDKWLRNYSNEVGPPGEPLHGFSDDDGELYVHSLELGKYRRRVVGIVWGETDGQKDDVDVSTYLLSQGLCKPYSGGTKEAFTESELKTIEAKAKAILQESP